MNSLISNLPPLSPQIPHVTKAIAVNPGQATFYHVTARNRDGSAIRVRVNGKCKVWVTRPEDFRLPIARGMYEHGYITHNNCHDWLIADPTVKAKA
jgi:hypothetical protein